MRAAGNFAVRSAQALERRASVAASKKTFVTVPQSAQAFDSQTKQKPVVPGPKAPVTTATTFSAVQPKPVEGARDAGKKALANDLDKLVREHRLFDFFGNLAQGAKSEKLTAADYTALRDVMLAYAHLRQDDALAHALNRIGETGFNLPSKNPGDAYYQALESSGPMRDFIVMLRDMHQSSSAHLCAAQELVDAHLAKCLHGVLVACKGNMTLQEFDRDVLSCLGPRSCNTTALAAKVAPQGPAEADTALSRVQTYAGAFVAVISDRSKTLDKLTGR
jgi:hypothetical protein